MAYKAKAKSRAIGDERRKREAMDTLVQEIAVCDDESVAGLLRSALERGWALQLGDVLTNYKKKKESEIDRICSRHYEEFLQSMNELLEMKTEASALSTKVGNIYTEFTSTGEDLIKVLDSLDRLQTQRENSKKLLFAIDRCKALSLMMLKAKEQFAASDHYATLRSLRSIQQMKHSVTIAPFARHLESWSAQVGHVDEKKILQICF